LRWFGSESVIVPRSERVRRSKRRRESERRWRIAGPAYGERIAWDPMISLRYRWPIGRSVKPSASLPLFPFRSLFWFGIRFLIRCLTRSIFQAKLKGDLLKLLLVVSSEIWTGTEVRLELYSNFLRTFLSSIKCNGSFYIRVAVMMYWLVIELFS
jgi:hypothetical protein